MTALILDDRALLAVDRYDRTMIARLLVAQHHGLELRNAMVVAQVWHDRCRRQPARLLKAIHVRPSTPARAIRGMSGSVL
jgi:hypothetical protein